MPEAGHTVDTVLFWRLSMRKITELLGLPVINLATGEQIGEVQDIVIDVLNRRMLGVLLRHAGWFSSGKGIPFAHVHGITADSLTVENAAAIVRDEAFAAQGQTLRQEDIIGKHIVTAAGKTVGTLSDIYVDINTGRLTGCEISDSVIKDLLEGRRAISLPDLQKIGKETVIVSEVPEAKQPVEEINL